MGSETDAAVRRAQDQARQHKPLEINSTSSIINEKARAAYDAEVKRLAEKKN